jgi:hypothetical protein
MDDQVIPLHMAAAAMFAESDIGPTKSRIINRYLMVFLGMEIIQCIDIPPHIIIS